MVSAFLAAWAATPLAFDAAWVRSNLVSFLSEACRDHGDGEPGFVTAMLDREAGRFERNVAATWLCLAGAALVALFLDRTRFGRGFSSQRGSTIVLAAVFGATATFVGQVDRAIAGLRDGLFTESEESRLQRAFDVALEPSRAVIAATPSDARIVVIDFPAPHVLQKFGYLAHPRKVFVPPRTEFRFSAAEVRQILREMPHGIDWCFEAGFTHIVDLSTLAASGDPAAIIDLSTLPR